MVMILYKYYKEVNTKMKYKKPKILIYSTLLYQIHTNDVPPKMTSKKLSEILQQHIVTATGTINRNTKHWETVLILNQTTVPTALIEVGFLTNPGDALKISNPEYQDTVAQAIADGIQEAMQYPFR